MCDFEDCGLGTGRAVDIFQGEDDVGKGGPGEDGPSLNHGGLVEDFLNSYVFRVDGGWFSEHILNSEGGEDRGPLMGGIVLSVGRHHWGGRGWRG